MPEARDVDNVFAELSEESLFQLLTVLTKRHRRAALKAEDPRDLKALRYLQGAAQFAHDKRLRTS